jgi:hypothetical protein
MPETKLIIADDETAQLVDDMMERLGRALINPEDGKTNLGLAFSAIGRLLANASFNLKEGDPVEARKLCDELLDGAFSAEYQ